MWHIPASEDFTSSNETTDDQPACVMKRFVAVNPQSGQKKLHKIPEEMVLKTYIGRSSGAEVLIFPYL